ncbi:HNH endonuclease [Archangium violaceum]|uniref:HNH endonuclease n=1 Tax=Archangium violaceum TaxID=83451 RepID=UPI001950FC54|nr:HNH endonuclease signature motif containing protein [Archangium violaceum]QRN93992.1 HNH endonuclease [Archangium violaceum]
MSLAFRIAEGSTVAQDGDMRRLHPFVLVALLPFLVGMTGVECWPAVQQQATAATNLEGSLNLDEVPATPILETIAGKRPGSRFTQKDKLTVKQDNASRNGGKTQCEKCGVETVPAQQHQKGITPPKNETQVDHVIPKSKGGPGTPDNGQVLCRDFNIKKSDKEQ